MQTNESEIYAVMYEAMLEMGAIDIRTSSPEKLVKLGIDSAKTKDIDRRDGIDNLMLLAYYRAMRITSPDGGTDWHASREGAVVSRLLYQPETIEYAMAHFLLNTKVN